MLLLATIATVVSSYVLNAQDKQMLSLQAEKFALKFAAIIDTCQNHNVDFAERYLIMVSGELPVEDVVAGLASQRVHALTKAKAYEDKPVCAELKSVVSNLLPELEKTVKKGQGKKIMVDVIEDILNEKTRLNS